MSSKYLSRRSLEPRSKSEGKLIVEFLRRSRENAPRELEGMPLRHSRDAPWFSGCAADLFRYFEEVRSLCERENCFDDQEWAKWVCWYASSEVSDSWYEFVEDQLSWPEFAVAIACLYPRSREWDQQYSRNDLYSLVDSRARREVCTEEELMNYRLYFLDLATYLQVSKQLEADELEDLYVQGFDKEFRREIIWKMQRNDRRRHSDDPWSMQQVTYTAARLLHEGFRSERARASTRDYYEPQSDPESSSDKQHLSTRCFLPTATHDLLTSSIQGATELSGYIECEKVLKLVSTSHAQPPSSSEKTKSADQSPGRLVEAAAVTSFETKEFSLSTNRILTTELQEAVELERVEPALVEGPLTTKVPFEFEANYNTQRGFSFCSYRASLMATGVSLQESYLRGQGNERSGLRIPAVSRNTHQLTNDPFRSKIPLEFEAERLKEHPKPTGVGVEGLEALTGSLEVERLAYKEVIDSHRAPQHMNHIESKVVVRRIQVEEPSRLIIRRKPPEEVLRIEMLKHAARMDSLALEMFHGSAVPAIYILFENPSRESMRALGIRTCRGSPAMLTKRSHVTALRVVAARTQSYRPTTQDLDNWIRRMGRTRYHMEATATTSDSDGAKSDNNNTSVSKDDDSAGLRATAMRGWNSYLVETRCKERGFWARRSKGKMDIRDEARRRPSRSQFEGQRWTTNEWRQHADKRPYEVGGAVRWERCATSADTELDGSELSTTNSDCSTKNGDDDDDT
ncbi:hypothetical protein M404DRAFT_22617 [Pisolithus tinctorius Marx 270]|uniref:Uncharacterized protein n=1 Tax=Pisolithus tinctorius Marx 270 TaxID=870435 RepID=A0A0C3P668_PISTI|nr:hypothetical protein M404DRAFT_22617 [Pisolithus tinctorius Marx 270]